MFSPHFVPQVFSKPSCQIDFLCIHNFEDSLLLIQYSSRLTSSSEIGFVFSSHSHIVFCTLLFHIEISILLSLRSRASLRSKISETTYNISSHAFKWLAISTLEILIIAIVLMFVLSSMFNFISLNILKDWWLPNFLEKHYLLPVTLEHPIKNFVSWCLPKGYTEILK